MAEPRSHAAGAQGGTNRLKRKRGSKKQQDESEQVACVVPGEGGPKHFYFKAHILRKVCEDFAKRFPPATKPGDIPALHIEHFRIETLTSFEHWVNSTYYGNATVMVDESDESEGEEEEDVKTEGSVVQENRDEDANSADEDQYDDLEPQEEAVVGASTRELTTVALELDDSDIQVKLESGALYDDPTAPDTEREPSTSGPVWYARLNRGNRIYARLTDLFMFASEYAVHNLQTHIMRKIEQIWYDLDVIPNPAVVHRACQGLALDAALLQFMVTCYGFYTSEDILDRMEQLEMLPSSFLVHLLHASTQMRETAMPGVGDTPGDGDTIAATGESLSLKESIGPMSTNGGAEDAVGTSTSARQRSSRENTTDSMATTRRNTPDTAETSPTAGGSLRLGERTRSRTNNGAHDPVDGPSTASRVSRSRGKAHELSEQNNADAERPSTEEQDSITEAAEPLRQTTKHRRKHRKATCLDQMQSSTQALLKLYHFPGELHDKIFEDGNEEELQQLLRRCRGRKYKALRRLRKSAASGGADDASPLPEKHIPTNMRGIASRPMPGVTRTLTNWIQENRKYWHQSAGWKRMSERIAS